MILWDIREAGSCVCFFLPSLLLPFPLSWTHQRLASVRGSYLRPRAIKQQFCAAALTLTQRCSISGLRTMVVARVGWDPPGCSSQHRGSGDGMAWAPPVRVLTCCFLGPTQRGERKDEGACKRARMDVAAEAERASRSVNMIANDKMST